MGDLGSGIQSIEKGLGLLKTLQAAAGPMRLSEIAAANGMTPSKARGYLVSLLRSGFVAQDPDSGRYDLGEAALHVGLTALSRLNELEICRGAMATLAAALGETAVLSIWSARGPVVTDKLEGRRDQVYEVRVGSYVRLLPTATGRVFMAFLPEEVWRPVLEDPDEAAAGATLPGADLRRELEAVRALGYAATEPATVPGFAAIAAPVHDHRNELRAVITVMGRAESFDTAAGGANVATVLGASHAASGRLGYAGHRRSA